MSRVSFTPGLINHLRGVVADHNARAAPRGAEQVRLSGVKSLYKRFHNGDDPHAHALAKIDGHLAKIRGEMQKAQEPFDPSRHPRGRRGQFRSGAGGETVPPAVHGQAAHYADVADRGADKRLRASNAGYDAAQTQVIPETRYSTFGPPIAGAAGVALGATAGALTTHPFNDPITRTMERGAGAITGKITRGAGLLHPKLVARNASRATIGAVNQATGSKFRRPHPASKAQIEAARDAAQNLGRKAGKGAVRAWAIMGNGPAAAAHHASKLTVNRLGMGRVGRAVIPRGAGLLAGAIYPGALIWGPVLYHTAANVGPYLDQAFPRRVRKIAGELWDDEQVLAKQAEALTSDLAKIQIANIARAALRSVGSRFTHTTTPSVASHSVGAVGHMSPHAQRAFHDAIERAAGGGGFTVPPRRAARAAFAGVHGIAGAAAGAGAGAGLGAAGQVLADRWHEEEHPRDSTGRFSNKAARAKLAAKRGAVAGSVTGLGVGLLVGLAAARRGHGALLGQALERLGGARERIMGEAQGNAREAHAAAHFDANRKKLGLKPRAPSGAQTMHGHVTSELKRVALDAWRQAEGAAIQGGPEAWYKHQVDRAFDATAKRMLRQVGGAPRGVDNKIVSANLFDGIDRGKLNEQQTKIFDDLASKREKALGSVTELYNARRANVEEARTHVQDLHGEIKQLGIDLDYVPERIREFEKNDTGTLSQVKQLAKDRMGVDLKARTRETALEEIQGHIDHWDRVTRQRVEDMTAEVASGGNAELALRAARAATATDMADAERMAVANPFSSKSTDKFFQPIPNLQHAQGEVEQNAVRIYDREAEAHAKEALEHAEAMFAAREADLQSAIPKTGPIGAAFDRAVPQIAARMRQGQIDYVAISTASRNKLSGSQRAIADWLHAQANPAEAMRTAKKLATGAARQGKRMAAAGGRNWKYIVPGIGIGTTLGVVDLNGPRGERVRINPKRWRKPADLRFETVPLDPINRPNEGMFGVSFKDRDGQRKFLHGVHITSADGTSRTMIPFGADVAEIKNTIRNRGRGGGDNQNRGEIRVNDSVAASTARTTLSSSGGIKQMGPAGATFMERTVGSHQTEGTDVARAYSTQHIDFLKSHPGQTHDKPHRFWQALSALFEDRNSALLNRNQRSGLLFGVNDKRGLLSNKGGAFDSKDNEKITIELAREIRAHPTTANGNEHRNLQRVAWIAGQHFGLSQNQQTRLASALHDAVQGQQPGGQAQPGGQQQGQARNMGERLQALIDQKMAEYPTATRPEGWQTDVNFRDTITGLYQRGVKQARAANPQAHDNVLHQAGVREVDEMLDEAIKSDGPSDLRKYLRYQPQEPQQPKLPGAPGMKPPPIAGAAKPGKLAQIGREAKQSFAPAHALGQIGSYGLGQAGFDAVEGLSHLVPNRALRLGLKWGGGTLAGAAGGIGGMAGGQAAGRALGDRSHERAPSLQEAGVRGVAGLGAQVIGTKAATLGATRAVERAVIPKIAGAATRLATKGLGQRVGAQVGGWLGGGAGAVAGSVEPGAGTVAGGVIGRGLGMAAGAGLGFLADEGAGFLYRHLAPYGPKVFHIAANSLGISQANRRKHAAGFQGASA